MTQEQLGVAAGIEAATLSRYETGRRPPGLVAIERIARALKIEAADLITFEPARTATSPLRSDERELLSVYRSMRPRFRTIALRLVKELRRID